jgi:stage II sporulation protein D
MNDPSAGWIRVLLFDNIKKCRLQSAAGFHAAGNKADIKADFAKKAGKVDVEIKNNNITIADIQFGKSANLNSNAPYAFEINGKWFRGNLKLYINENKTITIINSLPMEAYLYGVIAAEMPAYWQTEALKAQTIASRTYAAFIKKRFGKNRTYDVKKTQANQVYKGVAAENARIRKVVDITAHKMLFTTVDGKYSIFPAYFSSVCGGHTEKSSEVFGDKYEPLSGTNCPFCEKNARAGLYNWKTVSFPVKQVRNKLLQKYPNLRQIGKITDIKPRRQSRYNDFSRITSVKITGENDKTAVIRGEDLRLSIDPTGRKIKSAAFNLDLKNGAFVFSSGRGFGHGVGLCQYGAQQMARQGFNAKQILRHYYPGAEIMKVSQK